jgi:hypothetical protein
VGAEVTGEYPGDTPGDGFWLWLADLTPRAFVYWCAVRLFDDVAKEHRAKNLPAPKTPAEYLKYWKNNK